ncbi:MAG: glycolate oxidase subunit GlcF [Gammaproteobacteria bacterium]|nr:glycolate oxidase subunit GlcF [Gammaproteobacteria bacterium]
MRTMIAPTLKNEDAVQELVTEISKCVHCGFCNSVCPTYQLTGNELQGPRGRIYLVKGLLERDDTNEALEDSLSKCLTCRACEPACPSGVQYGKIAEEARFLINNRPSRRPFLQRMLLKVIPDIVKFKRLYRAGRWFRPLVPSKSLREALSCKLPSPPTITGMKEGKVVLLQGCVQQALTPEVVLHLAKLLETRDIPFRVLSQERCCGSLNLHLGEKEAAQNEMTANVSQMRIESDEIILSTASGCGVTLKEYDRYLPQVEHASSFARAVRDICEYLVQFEFKKAHEAERVVFHSPCTLHHGQKISGLVETILTRTGYEVIPYRDAGQCCGSAGTYSLLQPEQAIALRDKKTAALTDVAPNVVVTANVGCQLFLEPALDVPVLHWIELLG